MNRIRLIAATALLCIAATSVVADSLREASRTDFFSADRVYRVRLDPNPNHINVTLSHKTFGFYRSLWSARASMAMFPSNAVVSSDGRFVALLCGYVSRSQTKRTVSVFGQDGQLVRSLDLQELFSAKELLSLRTVSGYSWLRSVTLGGGTNSTLLIVAGGIPMPTPAPGTFYDPPELQVRFRIPLPVGHIVRE